MGLLDFLALGTNAYNAYESGRLQEEARRRQIAQQQAAERLKQQQAADLAKYRADSLALQEKRFLNEDERANRRLAGMLKYQEGQTELLREGAKNREAENQKKGLSDFLAGVPDATAKAAVIGKMVTAPDGTVSWVPDTRAQRQAINTLNAQGAIYGADPLRVPGDPSGQMKYAPITDLAKANPTLAAGNALYNLPTGETKRVPGRDGAGRPTSVRQDVTAPTLPPMVGPLDVYGQRTKQFPILNEALQPPQGVQNDILQRNQALGEERARQKEVATRLAMDKWYRQEQLTKEEQRLLQQAGYQNASLGIQGQNAASARMNAVTNRMQANKPGGSASNPTIQYLQDLRQRRGIFAGQLSRAEADIKDARKGMAGAKTPEARAEYRSILDDAIVRRKDARDGLNSINEDLGRYSPEAGKPLPSGNFNLPGMMPGGQVAPIGGGTGFLSGGNPNLAGPINPITGQPLPPRGAGGRWTKPTPKQGARPNPRPTPKPSPAPKAKDKNIGTHRTGSGRGTFSVGGTIGY